MTGHFQPAFPPPQLQSPKSDPPFRSNSGSAGNETVVDSPDLEPVLDASTFQGEIKKGDLFEARC